MRRHTISDLIALPGVQLVPILSIKHKSGITREITVISREITIFFIMFLFLYDFQNTRRKFFFFRLCTKKT